MHPNPLSPYLAVSPIIDWQHPAVFAQAQALALEKGLREQMTIVSKCGIVFPNAQLPEMKSKHYDNSRAHIVWSAERSVEKLQCGYLDLLLIHRPSPCAHPEEIAAAFAGTYCKGIAVPAEQEYTKGHFRRKVE